MKATPIFPVVASSKKKKKKKKGLREVALHAVQSIVIMH